MNVRLAAQLFSESVADALSFCEEAIYKKLLIQNELTVTGTGTDCIPLENISILTCSSADKINLTTSRKNIADSEKTDSEDMTNIDVECQIFLSPFGEKVVKYISGFVVFHIKKISNVMIALKAYLGNVMIKALYILQN